MLNKTSKNLRGTGTSVLTLFTVGLALASAACTTSSSGSSGRFDAPKALQLLDSGARIVDVRTPAEFASGHLDQALNIPVQELQQRLSELEPRDKPVVLYCRSGNRSGQAATLLRASGFTEVHDIKTMAGWPLR